MKEMSHMQEMNQWAMMHAFQYRGADPVIQMLSLEIKVRSWAMVAAVVTQRYTRLTTTTVVVG